MGRAAAAAAPTDPKQIMEARRAAYREEQGLPDVKWSCFAEQRKHEDFAAVRRQRGNHRSTWLSLVATQVKFAQKQAALQAKNAKPDRKVTDFVRRIPVSYTHLRAHETPEHLVCRLLLEKK